MSAAPQTQTGSRILVVDDCPLNRAFAAAALAAGGHEVMLAASGPSALAVVDAVPLDMILLDLDLGTGIDGFFTARSIRNGTGPNRSVVILAYSSSDRDMVREPLLAAGMDGHLEKPCSLSNLLEGVGHWLAVHPRRAGAR